MISLDHYLGNSFGLTICKELKANPETCDIPVILISGVDNLRELAEDCKADTFILKPFNVEEPVGKVESYSREMKLKNFPAS